MKFFFTYCFLFVLYFASLSQTPADSTLTLDSITVKAFEQHKTTLYSTIAVTVLPYADFSPKTSLVNGLNMVSGVRMEERSPGSYRLSIRGSSLRSPFGVRNIKVYWNGFAITDPGGNTYFNQFAWNNFSSIEIVKGPVGSMYGAGTGGLILLSSTDTRWQPGISAEYITGSYGIHNVFLSGRFGKKENKNIITYAHNQTDGYRVQSSMRRDNFSWLSAVTRERYDLMAAVLFTDMYYQTPGALTLAEYRNNPKSARPAAGGLPSAVNAKAAIFQKNLLAGLSGLFRLSSHFKNTTTFSGAFAQVKNPAVRNYERRNEPSLSARTVFTYRNKFEKTSLSLISGAELQQGWFNTTVSKNKNGNPDTLQTNDDINITASSFFAEANADIDSKWFFTTAIAANKTNLFITRLNQYPVRTQSRKYKNDFSPLFALARSFRVNKSQITWLLRAAKGFSPPTIAEVLPSTGIITTELDAEKGWNYESTLRFYLLQNKLKLELTAFYFRLYDALVQRRDSGGADYFINAGDTKQKGLEFHADYKQKLHNSLLSTVSVRTDITLNNFRYGSFIKGADNFSGKKLPSVPSSVIALLADAECRNGLYLNINYYGASAVFLNDVNTARDESYYLLGCQAGFKKKWKNTYLLNFFAGADNLLDEKYSLGNDINAAAGRYFNAAPGRNYYIGISMQWISKQAK